MLVCVSAICLFDNIAMLIRSSFVRSTMHFYAFMYVLHRHACIAFVLSFCHGKSEGPYHLLKCIHGGTVLPNVQVRNDDLPGSCIHKMHLCHA